MSKTTISTSKAWHSSDANLNAARDWLRANDIDPNRVPLDSEITVTDEEITYMQMRDDMTTRQNKTPLMQPLPDRLHRLARS